jgi:hypothetical protein
MANWLVAGADERAAAEGRSADQHCPFGFRARVLNRM